MSNNGGVNRVRALDNALRGGVVIQTDEVKLEQASRLIAVCHGMALWPDVGPLIDVLRTKCDNPPTVHQQCSLNALAALAVCQVAVRDAIAANAKAHLEASRAAPPINLADLEEGESSDG